MLGKKKPMNGLFAQLQDVKDEQGRHLNTVLFSDKGDCSVIIEVENPVQQYCPYFFPYCFSFDIQVIGEAKGGRWYNWGTTAPFSTHFMPQ